ncbi:restriction endonuclease subunit S [Plantibacter sp. H53]|uniref:restriction endonuclease subunit S n=1 Tax=Plantibacter sp. H53 TaxID=1827323 RepID=UPI0007D9B0F7|nr:restriction endonuclease subunit S [Plantibacter sp. H53]
MTPGRRVSLGDIIKIKHGFAFKGEDITTERQPHFLVTPGNFSIGGGFKLNRLKYFKGIPPEEYVLRPGDLVVTMTDLSKNMDTLGYAATVPSLPPGLTALHNQRIGLISITSPDVDQSWLEYRMRASDYRAEVLASSSGSTVHHTSPGRILEFQLDLPSLEYQREVASTLSALDDKIESNRRANALISDLLDAKSEKFGAGLPTVPLRIIAKSIKETANPSKLGDAVVDHFSLPAFDSGARPERAAAARIMSNKLRVPQHAVLLSRLNPRFNRTWWVTAGTEAMALASTEFLVLTAEDGLELAAVWLAVRDPFFREELPKRVTGTSGSHQRVRPDDALAIEVPDFRSAALEVKQSTLALLMRAESLRIESDRVTTLRDSLLPELLFGRRRIPVEGVAV